MWNDFVRFCKQTVGSVFGITIVLMLIGVVLLVIFRMACVNFVDNYELGYKFDLRTGTIERIGHTGYVVTPPIIVQVHTIDLRPMQVCINANSRVLNCKLVKFNSDGMELFLSWHGRNDYANDSGTGMGGSGNFNQILMSYAYDGSGRKYPFLTVIRELKPEEQLPPDVMQQHSAAEPTLPSSQGGVASDAPDAPNMDLVPREQLTIPQNGAPATP